MSSIIVLFAKAPAEGQVKSRLASSLSETVATELYKCFVEDTVSMLRSGSHQFKIYYYPPESETFMVHWLGKDFNYAIQKGVDLGERMDNAFTEEFRAGHKKVILMGSDIPDLPGSLLDDALDSLDSHDAVLGPSRDGGYYLIGFNANSFNHRVFQDIRWSTSAVFRQTMSVLQQANSRVHLLRELRDIDVVEDITAYCWRHRNDRNPSKTATYLRNAKIDPAGR
jgi:uncharacterized protein